MTIIILMFSSPSSSSFSPSILWLVSVFTAPFPSNGWLLAQLVSVEMRDMGTEGGDRSGELHVLTSLVVLGLDEWSLWPLLHTYICARTQSQIEKLLSGKPQTTPVSLWCFMNATPNTIYLLKCCSQILDLISKSLVLPFQVVHFSRCNTDQRLWSGKPTVTAKLSLLCMFSINGKHGGWKESCVMQTPNAISRD